MGESNYSQFTKDITKWDVLRYMVQWETVEKNLFHTFHKINQFDIKEIEDTMTSLLNHFSITRNFEGSKKTELATIIKNLKKSEKNVKSLNEVFIDKEILRFSDKNHKKRIKNAYVASSKILWFFDRDNIIIMDNNNIKVLREVNSKKIPEENGYEKYKKYIEIWQDIYDKNARDEINKKINEIKNCFKLKYIDDDWFKRRVFDIYLWRKGK